MKDNIPLIIRRYTKLFLIFFGYFLLLLSGSVEAQEAIFFKSIRASDGLSNNKVNCVLQDKRGFLWIGTEDGLNRYDGRYIYVIRSEPEHKASLSGNIISDLYEDDDGILWIATKDGGITKYDYRLAGEHMFKKFKYDASVAAGIPENHINKIVGDRFGNLWLASSRNYVIRFNKKTEHFDIPVQRGTRGILSLAIDDKDTLWAGREGGGLLKIDTKSLSYVDDESNYNLYKDLPNASLSAIFKDKKGDMWCGSWDKAVTLFAKDARDGTNVKAPEQMPDLGDIVLSFADGGNGKIWMATENAGAALYDAADNSLVHFRHDPYDDGSLISNQVNTVYVDRSGTVWIGTDNGLSVYNPLFYPFKKHFVDQTAKDLKIHDFFKDNKDRLWIGTNNGLYLKRPWQSVYEHRALYYKGQRLAITKLFSDTDGTFYLGTDYTLFVYDTEENTIEPLPNTEQDPVMGKLMSSRIVSIVKDTINNHPVLIVSPYGHYISYYDLQEQRWVSRMDSTRRIIQSLPLKDHRVPKFYKDGPGLWMATSSYGLAYWNPQKKGSITYFSNNPSDDLSLNNNYVYDIASDRHNKLWVSTYGGGLSKYDKNRKEFFHVTYSSNLSEGVQVDKEGDVWMVSNGHIHKYEELSGVYSCYDIPSLQKVGGVKGYLYKDRDGNIYAAGDGYYIFFNPDDVEKVDYSPVVYFTDFKIFQQSHPQLLQEDVVRLNYKENFFSISFSAPDFSGDHVQYTYMLEGFDKDWIDAGKSNIASYANLSGGKYRFLLQARNWKGKFDDPYKVLDIYITPPFWKTWWFYFCVCIILSSAAYAIHRYRTKVRTKHNLIRNEIARDLHDQVGSTLSSIAIYAEVAKIYHEQEQIFNLKEVLRSIHDSANDMANEMGDIVWALNTKNDHFASLINRIKSFAHPLCSAKRIDFVITSEESLNNISLDMKKRKNLFLILKEAINNAVKYADCRQIAVAMQCIQGVLRIEIEDDGKGFDLENIKKATKSEIRGNGIANLKFRANDLGGSLIINSELGKGTLIVLTFPCKK